MPFRRSFRTDWTDWTGWTGDGVSSVGHVTTVPDPPMPLDGVVVADFSRVLAGPLATANLADLGATVIKVERPRAGDDTRHWGPPWTETASSYFESANRSKQSIELDLDDADDREVARRLALRADVLVENFRTGTLDRRGLGYEQLREQNPGLVYASITGFGSREGAELSGYDFLVQAVGGLMSVTGTAEQPTKVGVALVDVLTSKDLTIGVLAALRAREASGRGQRVEVNLLSSLLGSMVNQASSFLATGESPRPMGNRHPSITPYETLHAADGQIALCCGNDRQFATIAEVLGVPALAGDERFATNPARVAHREVLVDVLETALAADGVDAWVARLQKSGVPAGKVGTVADAFDLAARLGLEPRVAVDGAPDQVRSPLTMSDTPITRYTPPPRLGEHNDDVRRWLEEA